MWLYIIIFLPGQWLWIATLNKCVICFHVRIPSHYFLQKIDRCSAGFDFTYNGHCYYYYGESEETNFNAASDVSILPWATLGSFQQVSIAIIVYKQASRGSLVDSTSAHCAGHLPIESRHSTSATHVACREHNWLPCWLPRGQQVSHQRWISGIHFMQATKYASEGSTLALKPRGDIIRSPKQGYKGPTKRTHVLQKL